MRCMKKALAAAVLISSVFFALASTANAYPEFESAIEKASGRNVDCSFCHENPDGPDGVKAGQIGSLSRAEFQELNRARTAFEPGANVDSPILNDFGDHLLDVIGKKRIVKLRKSPLEIPELLGDSDLDQDGIPDAEEFLDGTHPLIHDHGAPTKLFIANIQAYWPHLLMLMLATFLGIYGLENILIWFGLEAQRAFDPERDET